MNKQEKAYETRKQLRLEKLGTDHPVCVVCSENHWECLELHHLAGKAYGDDLVILCRNCHRKLSVQQDAHPQKTTYSPSFEESLGHMLLGLADFFVLLARSLGQYGEQLLQKVKELSPKEGDAK